MKRIVLVSFCILSAVLIFANPNDGDKVNTTAAAISKAQIKGQIIDKLTGEALVGVQIKLKGEEQSHYTDLDGNFLINNIVPGKYDINVSYISYKERTLKEIKISDSSEDLKVELELNSNI